jgi:hypothetical protein
MMQLKTKSHTNLLRKCITCPVTNKLVLAFATTLKDLLPLSEKPKLSLAQFIANLASSSQISSVVIYIATIYLHRLRPILSGCSGLPTTLHRLALSSILLAEKSICDVAMKNKFWALHSQMFSLEEVNLMERQMLSLLVLL